MAEFNFENSTPLGRASGVKPHAMRGGKMLNGGKQEDVLLRRATLGEKKTKLALSCAKTAEQIKPYDAHRGPGGEGIVM